MAVKYKQDKNNEFKSIDRDIREHDLERDDFDYSPTDSTCPFKCLIDEIRQAGEEYSFALNTPDRINRLLARGWYIVSSERLKNKRSYRGDLRSENDCITTGDTIILARDERYGIKEREYYDKKSVRIMKDTLQRVRTDVFNPVLPFSDKSYSERKEMI